MNTRVYSRALNALNSGIFVLTLSKIFAFSCNLKMGNFHLNIDFRAELVLLTDA